MYSVLTVEDRKNNPLYREFTCDTVADLQDLPTNQPHGDEYGRNTHKERCATGSVAIVIETSDVYMLNSSGEWKKL